MSLQSLVDDFSFLSDWDDRYRYIIELGRTLPPFPDDCRTDEHKVQGCASQVWFVSKAGPEPAGRIEFLGDSDAHIVRGLIAILFQLYSGKTPDEILEIDPQKLFDELGLIEHLSPQRSNGLISMVKRIRKEAAARTAGRH